METKNGVVETRYDNGQLKTRATYKDGELNGLCEAWYNDGKPMGSVTYKDGVAE